VTDALRFKQARDLLQQHRSDLAQASEQFRWPQLTHFNWAVDFFDVEARGNDRPALWIVEEDGREHRQTYAELSARSSRVANHLRGLGVRRGDRVLLMLPNHPALWEAMLAIIKLGAVMIPSTMLLSRDDLVDRLTRGEVRHVITMAAETGRFAGLTQGQTLLAVGGPGDAGWQAFEAAYEASPDFQPDGPTPADDPLILYFTSGTTAKPKLVLHSHQSYPAGHLSTMFWTGLQAGDVHWNISSPGWGKHAWSCFFAPLIAGATVFIYNYARFHAPAALQTIQRCGVTSLCAPPTVWRMLIQEDLSAWKVPLRALLGAGEPLNPEVIEQVQRAWGLTIRDGFGQTESTAQIGNSPDQPVKAGSMGRPLPGYTVVLLDPQDQPADEGEIALTLGTSRPLGLMLGYAGDADKTAEVMRDGYYRTGDVARRDADGYITYVGRADDVFKASDYRISPFELESVLIEHEAVAEAAVVPSPDPIRLAVPKAFVVLAAGHTPSRELAESILAFSRERLASYKRIRLLEFADLPKTISGKIRRVELRKGEQGRVAGERRANEYGVEDFPALKG
jgi:acetyl-CoA synthetase